MFAWCGKTVCVRVSVCVHWFQMLFFCQKVRLGETLKKKKAEKSRTRTYGPPPLLRLSEEADIEELFRKKNGSNKEKQESLKT